MITNNGCGHYGRHALYELHAVRRAPLVNWERELNLGALSGIVGVNSKHYSCD
jgi:hypothetical protein